jgi:AraC-like DNA-binding protein
MPKARIDVMVLPSPPRRRLATGELDESGPGSSIALPSLLDLLLVHIIRSWMAEATSGTWPRALGDPVTAAALRALHADPSAPWSDDRLAAIAGRVGYGSPYALSHAFEREFGTTPGRYRAKGTFEPGPLPRVGFELGDLRRAGRAGDPEGDLAQ